MYVCLFMIFAKDVCGKQYLSCTRGMDSWWIQTLPKQRLKAHQDVLNASAQRAGKSSMHRPAACTVYSEPMSWPRQSLQQRCWQQGHFCANDCCLVCMRSSWHGTPSRAAALTWWGVRMMETKSLLMSLTFRFPTSSSTPAMVSTSHPLQLVTIKLMGQWHCA